MRFLPLIEFPQLPPIKIEPIHVDHTVQPLSIENGMVWGALAGVVVTAIVCLLVAAILRNQK